MTRFEDIEDKERYFIQPYVEGRSVCIKIHMKNNVVSVISSDACGKKTKLNNQIRKELVKSYKESKFHGYPIILDAVISTDKKNRDFLVLIDLMLEDERNGNAQSKRYEIRHDNIVLRFLNKSNRLVKAVFSHAFNEVSLSLLIDQFIKTDALNKIVFRKNVPKGFDDNEVIEYDPWTSHQGKILDFEVGQGVKKEFDEKQDLVTETPFEYLKCFKVFCESENKTVMVELSNKTESEKVDMLSGAKELVGRNCTFKEYTILNDNGFIFGEII